VVAGYTIDLIVDQDQLMNYEPKQLYIKDLYLYYLIQINITGGKLIYIESLILKGIVLGIRAVSVEIEGGMMENEMEDQSKYHPGNPLIRRSGTCFCMASRQWG